MDCGGEGKIEYGVGNEWVFIVGVRDNYCCCWKWEGLKKMGMECVIV